MSELEPPDFKRCQAEITEGPSFMRFGSPVPTRCNHRAEYILFEDEPYRHGVQGSMSVCAACLKKFQRAVHEDKVPSATHYSLPDAAKKIAVDLARAEYQTNEVQLESCKRKEDMSVGDDGYWIRAWVFISKDDVPDGVMEYLPE